MKINEAEQAVGITRKNIRFYEEQGLLNPSRNLSNGYREYSSDDILKLRRIKLLRKLGIPIEDIKKLQAHYFTLEDCLHRHLITLERESQNLNSMQNFCHRLLDENVTLESMDVEQLLADMDVMEEGGTRFMDVRKKDKLFRKRSALISAVVFICLMLLFMGLFLWAFLEDSSTPVLVPVICTGFPLICIGGTLLALKERLKEIEGGELDEASKY
jgi:DNA-binding transcriptional MerR regulator